MKKEIKILTNDALYGLQNDINEYLNVGWELISTDFNNKEFCFIAVMQFTKVENFAKKKTAKDLIVEMEYNGEKFVPLAKIFKIHSKISYASKPVFTSNNDSVECKFFIENNEFISFTYDFDLNSFRDCLCNRINSVILNEFRIKNLPRIFAALNDWGFDLTQKD